MGTKIDLRGGGIVITEKGGEVVRLTKSDLLLSRNENDIRAKFKVPPGVREQVYYFNENVLFDGWDCISGPVGMTPPTKEDWGVEREGSQARG